MKRILKTILLLALIGAALGGVLYWAYPVQMSTIGGLTRNYVLSLNAPPGTATTETNPAYKEPAPPAAADTATASTCAGDWPSYNRTLASDRYSPLSEINTKNAAQLKVLCTYDVGGYEAFESGLIMVNDALIGTTEFDIFSLNPVTCALNLRTQ